MARSGETWQQSKDRNAALRDALNAAQEKANRDWEARERVREAIREAAEKDGK